MRSRPSRPALIAALAVAMIGLSQTWLVAHPLQRDPAGRLLYLPNGRFLRLAALGHPTLLADLIYLWSIQYYGAYRGADRFAFLDHVYGSVIARLDPRYVDPYLIGALIMVLEKQDLEAGLRLLDQGMAANPDEWILPYEAGFFAYDIGHDYPRAAAYFERALSIPGAPASVRRLHAEMFNRHGDKERSLALWREVLRDADPKIAAVAANHVHDLAIEVDCARLGGALAVWRERHGRWPPALDTLVADGLLASEPLDPDGRPYFYDPASGSVTSATPFRLRRR